MKYVCSVCGYVHEGETATEKCPMCGAKLEWKTDDKSLWIHGRNYK